jgi:hypothetical protein
VWATSLVTRARKEGLIKDDFAVKTIIDVSLTNVQTWKEIIPLILNQTSVTLIFCWIPKIVINFFSLI